MKSSYLQLNKKRYSNHSKSQTNILNKQKKFKQAPFKQSNISQSSQLSKLQKSKSKNTHFLDKNIKQDQSEYNNSQQTRKGSIDYLNDYLLVIINEVIPEMQKFSAQQCLQRRIFQTRFNNRPMQEIIKVFLELFYIKENKWKSFQHFLTQKLCSIIQPLQKTQSREDLNISNLINLIQSKFNRLFQANQIIETERQHLQYQTRRLQSLLQNKDIQLANMRAENGKLRQQLERIEQIQGYCQKSLLLNITNIFERGQSHLQKTSDNKNKQSKWKQLNKIKKDALKHISQSPSQFQAQKISIYKQKIQKLLQAIRKQHSPQHNHRLSQHTKLIVSNIIAMKDHLSNYDKTLKIRIDVLNRTVLHLQQQICGQILYFEHRIKEKKNILHRLEQQQTIKNKLSVIKQNSIRTLIDQQNTLTQTLKNIQIQVDKTQNHLFIIGDQLKSKEKGFEAINSIRQSMLGIGQGMKESIERRSDQYDKESGNRLIAIQGECSNINQNQYYNKRMDEIAIDTYQSQQQRQSDNPLPIIKNKLATIKHLTTPKQISNSEILFPTQNNRFIKYFHLDILQDEDDQKQYLAQIIQQSNNNKKIIKTKLLFKYDQHNHTSITKYVQDKPYFVLIVQTQSDYIIAFYSQKMISSKHSHDQIGKGLIISLTNRKIFKNLPNRKAAYYNDRYLIFGNSQARVSSNQLKLFSNFGISNAYYENGDENLYTIFGSENKEMKLKHIQVYQVVFEQ